MKISEFQKRIDDPFDSDRSKYRRSTGGGSVSAGVVATRVVISLLLAAILMATLMWSLLYSIANGPSDAYRNKLVTDACASDATRWIPYIVLPAAEVDRIVNDTGVGG